MGNTVWGIGETVIKSQIQQFCELGNAIGKAWGGCRHMPAQHQCWAPLPLSSLKTSFIITCQDQGLGLPSEKVEILYSSVKLLLLPTSDARTQSKALWTHGVPAAAQETEWLTFTLEKKAEAAWSERSLRLVLQMAHRAQYECVVGYPFLSFHTGSPTHHSSCHRKLLFWVCSSKTVVSSCKTVNLEIWPHLIIRSSKRKGTLVGK